MTVVLPPRTRGLRPSGLLTAAVVVVAAAAILPLAYLLIRVGGSPAAAIRALGEGSTAATLVRTVLLAAAATGGAAALAVPLAWLTARTDLPLRRAWSVLLALPLAVPSYVGAFALVGAVGPGGLLASALEPLGLRLPSPFGFAGAVLVLALFTYPYVLLPARAALRSMDPALDESARSLGASRRTAFLRVTLPHLRPAVASGGLLVALYALSDFGAVSILRFDSLTRVIFVQYQSAFDRTSAAALALVLVLLAGAAVWAEQVSRGGARYHGSSVSRLQAPVRLGPWRWPALALCALVAIAALLLPLSVIGFWLTRDLLGTGRSLGGLPAAALGSVTASGLAGAAAVVVAVPVAVLSVRHAGALADTAERVAYAGFAVPGVAMALALVFFAANVTPWVYQTLGLLVFAYVIRFLPQAVGSVRGSLLQLSPHTEEVARSLGRSGPGMFARVVVPQIAPGLLAGGLLVWLTAMKELPATMLLAPPGFETLATRLWSASTSGFLARAAAPALALVVVAGIPMAVMALRGERTEP